MNLQGDLKSNFNTDGRTDGTKKVVVADSQVTVVDADARIDGQTR